MLLSNEQIYMCSAGLISVKTSLCFRQVKVGQTSGPGCRNKSHYERETWNCAQIQTFCKFVQCALKLFCWCLLLFHFWIHVHWHVRKLILLSLKPSLLVRDSTQLFITRSGVWQTWEYQSFEVYGLRSVQFYQFRKLNNNLLTLGCFCSVFTNKIIFGVLCFVARTNLGLVEKQKWMETETKGQNAYELRKNTSEQATGRRRSSFYTKQKDFIHPKERKVCVCGFPFRRV